jgi:tetratricopeptide (TPR) repeat protein
MASDAVELADSLVFTVTGRHLSDLQRTILGQVWQGRKYLDIAHKAGYTEGHIKDVASQLWKLLSKVTGERITKSTVKSALERHGKSLGIGNANGSLPPAQSLPLHRPETSATSGVESPQSPVLAGLPGELGSEAFSAIATEANAHFVGRQPALAELQTLIREGNRAIVIQGEGGLGKTTLAQHFVEQLPVDITLELLMAKEADDITPVEWVVEEWLRQDFGVEPGREFGVTLDRLKRHLRKQRVAVFIDNLEPCLDAQGRFISAHRRYRELLRVLTDSRSQAVTVMTSRDRICEPGIPLTHYRLPGLDQAAWKTYFAQRGIIADDNVLTEMHNAYGGNAKAMEILRGAIQADFDSDMVTYWHIHGQDLLAPVDLRNLVESQIDRLKVLDPDAYTLFCRLGVYRFQDVPTVSMDGLLCLMEDLPESQRQATITSLQNRSLLEYRRGQYWLHPVVREGAIAQLWTLADALTHWQMAHRHAARYWTQSVTRIHTIEDALQALEAYYHYVAIEDWAAAARVMLHSRDNQWGQFLPLGSTLYRMGRVQPVTDGITAILRRIPDHSSDASELHNILGDLCWIQGRIQDAIGCQESAIAIAQRCLQSGDIPADSHRHYYLTMLLVDSQLSLGLYHLDLWELEQASTWFRQVIDLATGTRHQRWSDKATICLALVKSYQGHDDAARNLAEGIVHRVLSDNASGRHAFFAQLLGHTYLNLGDYAQARALLEAAVTAAEAGHYLQIEANALSGLGRLSSQTGQIDEALTYHHHAIELLTEVGAQCDLATAHLHLAMTLAHQHNAAAKAELNTAITLFESIPAPQQVTRARQFDGDVSTTSKFDGRCL